MFTYWRGYEIDGSSTAYNIVVPQRELVKEVLKYFISLEIFDRNVSISLSYSEKDSLRNLEHKNGIYKSNEIDKLCEILERPSIILFSITTSCIHPEKLYYKIRKELYNLSKTRPGAENSAYNYRNPTVSPFYCNLRVGLDIYFYGMEKTVGNYEPDGLVFNRRALVNNMKDLHFTTDFDCGPGFIYEYAAYIMSKIAERFPEIGIDGGIDCMGGFTGGCTYSCSLYAYERITLTTVNIADAINSLLRECIILPQKRTGKYGNKILPSPNLSLYNLYGADKWRDDKYLDFEIDAKSKIIIGIVSGKEEYTPEEYELFIQKVSEVKMFDRIDFMHYCTCCIKIDDHICALTCIKENGGIWLELRVVPEIRDELEKKLNLCGLATK